jgi:four helix bundle protein
MNEKPLITKSRTFAIKLITLLKDSKNFVLFNQLLRSGTSIGANIHEANYAHGKADLLQKCK